MATITFLSWNIEHYGPGKFVDVLTGTARPNAVALLEAIAGVAVAGNANILSILELSPSVSVEAATWLVTYLAVNAPGGAWQYVLVPTHKNDVYCVVYQSGHGFEFLIDPANNNEPVRGYTQRDVLGNNLKFHSRHTDAGGRRPGFVAFQTTDRAPAPEIIFTVICYHAMYSTYAAYNRFGIQNVANIAPVTMVSIGGTPQPVATAFIGGDFNVDYLSWPGLYSNVSGAGWSTAIDPARGNSAKSSLVNTTPAHNLGYPLTVDYRVNAYDNIFARNASGPAFDSVVIDMIHNLKAGNTLQGLAQNFNPAAIADGHLIGSNPPNTNEDAWHIYRYGISNHLPVIASFTV